MNGRLLLLRTPEKVRAEQQRGLAVVVKPFWDPISVGR